MPGFVTHYLFGNESINQISELQVKQLIKKYPTCFNLGLQGPDVFFYYLPAYFITKRNVGNLMHDTTTVAFFSALLDARNLLSTRKARAIADAYIYGFIGHYSLDTTCHPYIYCRSHYDRYKDVRTLEFGHHVALETDLDKALLWHFHRLLPSQFSPANTITLSAYQERIISLLLARAIYKTYPGYVISPFRVRQATRFMRLENRLMHDPSGIKKYAVRFLEQHILGHSFISSMIPSDTVTRYKDCCNLSHKKWSNPWNPHVFFHDDFYQLFDSAKELYLHRISLYRQCVLEDSDKSLDDYCSARNSLLSDLGDCSYLSGFPLA